MGVRERPTDKQTDRQKGRANKHAVIKAFREREREIKNLQLLKFKQVNKLDAS